MTILQKLLKHRLFKDTINLIKAGHVMDHLDIVRVDSSKSNDVTVEVNWYSGWTSRFYCERQAHLSSHLSHAHLKLLLLTHVFDYLATSIVQPQLLTNGSKVVDKHRCRKKPLLLKSNFNQCSNYVRNWKT
ncbi:CLUMA_CG015937, isoform A [Clunio marinus]|uniref:CLUMA_CG015937, isoform A n=1 Tax=Clunio marinus TaxID=568069 RepID=A0A1J1IUB6_9DIPT|nr:CLUMA_CG015937, isoform A [Clunio marinus]